MAVIIKKFIISVEWIMWKKKQTAQLSNDIKIECTK